MAFDLDDGAEESNSPTIPTGTASGGAMSLFEC